MNKIKQRILLSGLLGAFVVFPLVSSAVVSNVRFNEFLPNPTSGSGWAELINPTEGDIDLAGWLITQLVVDEMGSTTVSTTTLDHLIIPAGGLISLELVIGTSSDKLVLIDSLGNFANGVVYGLPEDPDYPRYGGLSATANLDQIMYSLGLGGSGPWMATNTPTRNWFNQSPTKQAILEALPSGISTNLSTSTDEANDWTDLGDIILSREGFDNVIWAGPHNNLTGTVERAKLLRLATELSNLVIVPITPPTPPRSGGGGGGSYSPPVLPTIDPATSTGFVLGTSTFRFTRMLRPGMRGGDIQELQKILKSGGFFKGEVTNYFGPVTKKALVLWQKKNKIRPATGVVGRPTLNYLNQP
jgi:hypothetical protein